MQVLLNMQLIMLLLIITTMLYKKLKVIEKIKVCQKIDELNTNIKLCNFIENRTVKIKENIKEINQKNKNKLRYIDKNSK